MTDPEKIKSEAYKQGFLFGFYSTETLSGASLDAKNPYPPGTIGHDDWFDGYLENFR